MMRVSKMTVYRLVHAGRLPAVRAGGSFRIHRRDFNEYFRETHLPRLRTDSDPEIC
ncbi:MAG: hypothetical protein QOI10_4638 [Solirubrobacterales bacterium]|jgi:excisionase family DNA binding protein|nr:hypothetical protein [Solirubrobacterales bacterium]